MILVAGVGELYQGDLDFGRVVAERLRGADLGPGVVVEDLSYGAVAAAQRLEELRPDGLVVVGAAARGRAPGSVSRRQLGSAPPPPAEVQRAVAAAVTGYVDVDLLVAVAAGLGALPERAVAIELEPSAGGPAETLSPAAQAALPRALALVREELARLAYESSSAPSA